MGTNFFWRETPCGECGRFDEMHVGKRSGGWSFGFRGYRHDPDGGPYSPFGFPVLSRADWRQVFTARSGELFDEYGERVDDPVAWLDSLPAPDDAQQRKERSLIGPYWTPDERDWRDVERFRFYDGEFS